MAKRQPFFLFTGLIASTIFCSAGYAFPASEAKVPDQEPPGTAYLAGIKFSETSEYRKQFSDSVKSAKSFCESYLKEHKGERNLAIVSDIDETLLDNREHFEKVPNRDWDQFDAWIKEARAPALKKTKEFLEWARKNGIAIFLVTGRREDARLATIENLVKVGVAYDGLYLRQKENHKERAEIFKARVRGSLEEMGFKILVSIGDQDSDLAGGHVLDCEKLPNRMYFIP